MSATSCPDCGQWLRLLRHDDAEGMPLLPDAFPAHAGRDTPRCPRSGTAVQWTDLSVSHE